MSPRTILSLANGRGIDLLTPMPSDYADIDWIAEHLSKEPRYNGATPGRTYVVAQHACLCADAALMRYGCETLAAYCLIHDNHEAVLKDDTTPKKTAIAEIAERKFGVLAGKIIACFDELTDLHDQALHTAAGLLWPPSAEQRARIKEIDLILFVTEWRDLMKDIPHPDWERYRDIEPLNREIRPWDGFVARLEFRSRAKRLLPAMRGKGLL